jgi:hypothetical protein
VVSGTLPALAVPASSAPRTWLDVDSEVLCTFDTSALPEVSGITYSRLHPGIIWATNDSYNGPFLYAIDMTDCRVRAVLRLVGSEGRDHEALAVGTDSRGRDVIWVGDIGDNHSGHPYARIYKVLEPRTLQDADVRASEYRFTYPGGPVNAEALLAAPDREQLWLITKEPEGGRLYALPSPLVSSKEPMAAQPAGPARSSVTDAAMSPDGAMYAVRDYFSAEVFRGEPPGRELSRFRLPLAVGGESITWTEDGRAVLVASEGSGKLTRVTVPAIALGTDDGLAPALPSIHGFSTYPYLRIAVLGVVAVLTLVVVSRRWRRRRTRLG